MPATRDAGRMYAARTLVHEDCRRNLEVALGRPLLDELWAPLGLILASARWFAAELAARYRRAFGEVFDALAGRAGSGGERRHVLVRGRRPDRIPSSPRFTALSESVVRELRPHGLSRWA